MTFLPPLKWLPHTLSFIPVISFSPPPPPSSSQAPTCPHRRQQTVLMPHPLDLPITHPLRFNDSRPTMT
ncbi:hypothetical protein Pyn_08212 [Prunus yedoensis var. nudiflora]|uniref:Uncharacterized protein n=1 Tax=Prunus yedoensis var. nudiflora TaxID=2094558 RepID=A0A314XLT5_PRUYE|nr:hypothetical protein Pyn_08212 [Prunus yedoensis var. nudiflora]